MKRFFVVFVAGLLLSSCMATPYQQDDATLNREGYSVHQLSEDVWHINFRANENTSRETFQTYWLYRAAELTLEQGYEGFEIISKTPFVRRREPTEIRENKPVYLRKAAFDLGIPSLNFGAPSLGGGTIENTRIIEGDIRLLKRPFVPSPPIVFDAALLKESLEERVNGKKCNTDLGDNNVCPHEHDYLFPNRKL